MNNIIKSSNTFIERYDHNILSTAIQKMYEKSGFYNVGTWESSPKSLKNACQALVRKHLELVDENSKIKKILDVGCGLGSTTNLIAQNFKNAEIIGINISEKQIAVAKDIYPDLDFQVMDATNLEFQDESYDLIISIEAAFHFNTRKDFLQQAFRVLRTGGQLIFTDMLFHNTNWVGNWSVPEANLVTDITLYNEMCQNVGFKLLSLQNIKNTTIKGFCQYLRQVENMSELANGLEESVIAYLITSLKK